MEIPQRALDVWGALAEDSGCLLPPHTARICPAPPARETTAPAARAGLWARPRPPRWGRASPATICPCRCSSTAAALKPNSACAQAARASPLPRPGHSTRISSRPPRHAGMAVLQHPARESLHGTGPAAATVPSTGRGAALDSASPVLLLPRVPVAPVPVAPSTSGPSSPAVPGAARFLGRHMARDAQPGGGTGTSPVP